MASLQVANKKCDCSDYVSFPVTHKRESSHCMWLERTPSQSSDLNLGSFSEYMLHQNFYCDVSPRSHYIVGSLLTLKRWCNALKTWISSCDLENLKWISSCDLENLFGATAFTLNTNFVSPRIIKSMIR